MKRLLSATFALFALFASNASGQTPSLDGWTARTTAGGCRVLLWRPYDQSHVKEWRWSGGCSADGLIEGEGVLIEVWEVDGGREEGTRGEAHWRGRAVNGLLEGTVTSAHFVNENADADGTYEGFSPPAGLVWSDTGVANPISVEYEHGCGGCIPGAGIAFRNSVLGAAATAAQGTVASPAVDTTAVNECIDAIFGAAANGATPYFTNTCGYAINFEFCNIGAREGSSAAMLGCVGDRGGLESIGAGTPQQPATRTAAIGGEEVSWFACRAPLTPSADFDPAEGKLMGRCNP